MGAADEAQILAGGTLSVGGTSLGTMLGVALELVGVVEDIRAEEYGGEVWDQIYLREEWLCVALLANWDSAALSNWYPNISSGDVTYPGTHTYGNLRSDDAVTLLLTPADATQHGGFTVYNAVPQLARTRIPLNAAEPLIMEVSWLGVRDASNRVVVVPD